MVRQVKPEDRREYTIKIIPHQGGNVHSIRVPIRLFKYGLASLAAGALLFFGATSFATYSAFSAAEDKSEIHDLQQVNSMQQEQLSQLAKKANTLQDQMDQIHQIEKELQQISGTITDEPEAAAPTHDGTGGPWVKPDVKNVRMALDNIEQRLEKSRANLENIRSALAQQQEIAAMHQRLSAVIPSIWPSSGDVRINIVCTNDMQSLVSYSVPVVKASRLAGAKFVPVFNGGAALPPNFGMTAVVHDGIVYGAIARKGMMIIVI